MLLKASLKACCSVNHSKKGRKILSQNENELAVGKGENKMLGKACCSVNHSKKGAKYWAKMKNGLECPFFIY